MTPARALRDRAESMLKPGQDVAFTTDAQAQDGVVLLAIATPRWSGVFTLDKTEYDPTTLAALFGFQPGPWPKPSMPAARKTHGRCGAPRSP